MDLVTGFPGFIATRLVARILRDPTARVGAIVLPDQLAQARARAERLGAGHRLELIAGDITSAGVIADASTRARAQASARRVFHLAALYDLAAPPTPSWRVNVLGTTHVLDLAAGCPGLTRFVHTSTCYVTGAREGVIREDELVPARVFRNHYEHTKHESERLVRERMGVMPATILRPAIVVGDSVTGATAKYDGPYFAMAAFARLEAAGLLRLAALAPDLGRGRTPLNLVPVDFVVAAAHHLAQDPRAVGGTFHLADPAPASSRAVMTMIRAAFGLGPPRWHLPAALARRLLALPLVERLVGLPRQLADYADLDQRFDTTRATALLAPAGIACPRPSDYLPRLVELVRRHPHAPPGDDV